MEKRSLIDIIRTRQKNWIRQILTDNSLCTEGDKGRKDGREQRKRKAYRQKLMDWMMKDGYWKLKEKAQHREEWSRLTFGPAGRQIS